MANRDDSELKEMAAECAAYRGLFLRQPSDRFPLILWIAIAVLRRGLLEGVVNVKAI